MTKRVKPVWLALILVMSPTVPALSVEYGELDSYQDELEIYLATSQARTAEF